MINTNFVENAGFTFGMLSEDQVEEILRSASRAKRTWYNRETDDADGFDAICRNASNPAYMRDAHTLKNMGVSFRECAERQQ